jgi:hypothetical protein
MSDALAMRLIQALPAGVARLFSQGARGAVEHSKRPRIRFDRQWFFSTRSQVIAS